MAAEHLESEFHELPAKAAARGFLPILWQRKALVLLGLVLGLAGGFLFYLQREPVYQSTEQVHVIKKNQPLIMPNADAQGRYYEDTTATHVVVMKSPRIIDQAIKKKELTNLKTFENSSDPIGLVLSSLAVTRDIKEGANNMVYLTFRGPVPDDCSKVLTAIVESYQEYLDTQFRNTKDEWHDQIIMAREVLKKDLGDVEEKLKTFNKTTSLSWTGKNAAIVTNERISENERKVTMYTLRKQELDVRIKSLDKAIKENRGNEEMAAMLENDEATRRALSPEKAAEKLLNDRLELLKLREAEMLQNYGEGHPQVLSIRKSMEILKENYKAMENGVGFIPPVNPSKDPAAHLLAVMKKNERDTDMSLESLDRVLKTLHEQARKFRAYDAEEEKLRNEAAGYKELFDSAAKKLKEISITRGDSVFNITTLSRSGPGVKVAPSAFQTIVGGSMLGLLLGIGLAFLADFTDKGFRSPDDVRLHLQLPLLGHVPFLKADPETEKKVKAGEIEIDPLLCALLRTKSLESEAYRAIRTALLFSIQGQGHRVIQVTSPSKGDGKSLTLANLAISIAQSEKKVLIIDADCRRPRQHKIFNLPNTLGLVNIIRQDATWQSCVQKTAADGLSILSSGPIPQNPAELLTSPQFKIFLEEARKEFDIVLVDSPPLLAVTDPCIVSGKVDGVVLVLRLSRQGRPNAERACEIMKSLKANVFGLVVNGVTRQGGGIYSSEHYDYAESYTEAENVTEEADYYYYEENDLPKTESAVAPAKSSSPGLWGRLFSRKT